MNEVNMQVVMIFQGSRFLKKGDSREAQESEMERNDEG
jgi:hypothetical protein